MNRNPDFSYLVPAGIPHDSIKINAVLKTASMANGIHRAIKVKKIYAVNFLTNGSVVIDFDGVEVNP